MDDAESVIVMSSPATPMSGGVLRRLFDVLRVRRVQLLLFGTGIAAAVLWISLRRHRRRGRVNRRNRVDPPSSARPQSITESLTPSDMPVSSRYHAVPLRRADSIRRQRHRNSPSTSNVADLLSHRTPSANENTMLIAGLENLLEAIRQWETLTTCAGDSADGASPSSRVGGVALDAACQTSLVELINRAQQLVRDAEGIAQKCGLSLPSLDANVGLAPLLESQLSAVGPTSLRRGTLSVLSDDSFVSALDEFWVPSFDEVDITLRAPLKLNIEDLHLYHNGLVQARAGLVSCRVMRTELVQCASDEEFLAKLWCVRQALESILLNEDHRCSMCDAGRRIISGLLKQANRDVQPFYESYDRMMEYLREPDVWSSIVEELRPRRVCSLSFYDIVLDFVLMDAFDDLAQPPSAVFAVTRNRYLSDSLKESTLKTIIWSVLKGKRSRLVVGDGFISRFYDISEVVSPVLAWGFLGTDDRLRELCFYFKEQISNFLVDIFHFDRVRYTKLEDLAEDIWIFCQTRAELIEQRLNSELLPPEL